MRGGTRPIVEQAMRAVQSLNNESKKNFLQGVDGRIGATAILGRSRAQGFWTAVAGPWCSAAVDGARRSIR
jgi:hypothetical protein